MRTEGRSPRQVFSCLHLKAVWWTASRRVGYGSQVSVSTLGYVHIPLKWLAVFSFNRHQNTRLWGAAKSFSTHSFRLEVLTAASGREVTGSCVFVAVFLDSSILCGKKKQIVFSYVEGKSCLNLESSITWSIFFEHGSLQLPRCGGGAQEV